MKQSAVKALGAAALGAAFAAAAAGAASAAPLVSADSDDGQSFGNVTQVLPADSGRVVHDRQEYTGSTLPLA